MRTNVQPQLARFKSSRVLVPRIDDAFTKPITITQPLDEGAPTKHAEQNLPDDRGSLIDGQHFMSQENIGSVNVGLNPDSTTDKVFTDEHLSQVQGEIWGTKDIENYIILGGLYFHIQDHRDAKIKSVPIFREKGLKYKKYKVKI